MFSLYVQCFITALEAIISLKRCRTQAGAQTPSHQNVVRQQPRRCILRRAVIASKQPGDAQWSLSQQLWASLIRHSDTDRYGYQTRSPKSTSCQHCRWRQPITPAFSGVIPSSRAPPSNTEINRMLQWVCHVHVSSTPLRCSYVMVHQQLLRISIMQCQTVRHLFEES